MSNVVDLTNFNLSRSLQSIVEDEDSWEDTCYIIMWQSEKSGGTYSEMRKTTKGKNKFVSTLQSLGVTEIHVTEQPKIWRPEKKKANKNSYNKEKLGTSGRRGLDVRNDEGKTLLLNR